MVVLNELLLYSSLLALTTGVTVIPWALTIPRQYENVTKPVSSPYNWLFPDLQTPNSSEPTQWPVETVLLRSSHKDPQDPPIDPEHDQYMNETTGIYASEDGFVRGTIDAWAQHQHLVIRPEDVWFTILTQLNFYSRGHMNSTQIRDNFDYNQEFETWFWVAMMRLPAATSMFRGEAGKRVKKQWLRDWIQPNFTTTTEHDIITANILMSGSVSPSKGMSTFAFCGLPSITLLGTQKDWEQLLLKLNRLSELGTAPAEYGDNLHPILSRFVRTFQEPANPDIRHFWNDVVSVQSGGEKCSNIVAVSGWINGFQWWDTSGNPLPRDAGDGLGRPTVVLDGKGRYPWRSAQDFPAGYVSIVSRISADAGFLREPAEIRAGMLGKKITKGAPEGYAAALRNVNLGLLANVSDDQHSMLQPVSAWFWFIDVRKSAPSSSLKGI